MTSLVFAGKLGVRAAAGVDPEHDPEGQYPLLETPERDEVSAVTGSVRAEAGSRDTHRR